MEITQKQKILLQAIYDSVIKNGLSPTLRELRDALGVSSDQSVIQFLNKLENGGFITRTGQRKARKILLTEKGYSTLGVTPPQESQSIVSTLAYARSARQEKIYRLLINTSEELGRRYAGGLMAFKTENNPESLAHSALSMRELIVGLADLSKFKFPQSINKEISEIISKIVETEDHSSHKNAIDEISAVVSGREPWIKEALVRSSDPQARNRKIKTIEDGIHKQMNDFYHRFSGIAHHDPITYSEYEKIVLRFETPLLMVLLPQQEVHENLDKIIRAGTSKVSLDKLKLLLRNTDAFAYFYDNVGSDWVTYLSGNDLLPFEWEIGRYLSRVANSAPQQVLEFIIKHQDNPDILRIIDLLMKAVELMPVSMSGQAIEIIKKKKWLQNEYRTLGSHYMQDLFKKLILEKEFQSALSLFEELTNIRSIAGNYSNKARATLEDYWLAELVKSLEKIPPAELKPFIFVLEKRLEKLIRIESGKDYDDHSRISRPSIAESERNWNHENLDDHFIDGLRDNLLREITGLKDNSSIILYLDELLGESPKFATIARIKLYAYNQLSSPYPEEVFLILKKYLYDNAVWHEYAVLLQKVYPTLTPKEKKELIALIEKGNETENQEYIRLARIRIYATLGKNLPKNIRAKYKKELPSFSGDDPTFTTGKMESWVGPESPVTESELQKMSLLEIISKQLISWEPEDDFHFGPSRGGLGLTFRKIVSERVEEFSKQSMLMANMQIRPVYIHNFLSGIQEGAKNAKKIDWTEVLKLIEWIINLAKENKLPPLEKGSGIDLHEIDWDETLQEVARSLINFLADNKANFGEFEKKVSLETILYLCNNEDPTKEDDEKYGGQNSDPYSRSINTIRGEAYHALFGYMFRLNRGVKETYIPKEIIPALEKGVDASQEHSLTIRSVYGKYLPWLLSYGKSWAKNLLPSILPIDNVDQRYAVWETYLSNQIFEDSFNLLLPFYYQSIKELGKLKIDRRFWVEPFERLAEHVMIAFVYEASSESNNLKDYFFKNAPQEHLASAISFAGRAYVVRDFTAGQKPPKVSNLMKLWEERLKNTTSATELREFGWWIKKDVFKNEWMLQKLLKTLQITGGNIDGEHVVLKTLQELAQDFPVLTAKCLDLIIKCTSNKDYTLQVYESEVKETLKKILLSKNSESIKQARKTTDYLLRLGFRGFKDLENSND